MSELARRASVSLKFNGKTFGISLDDKLTSISYTDVASGESDSVDITLENKGQKWMRTWRPKFGDSISGTIKFLRWYNAKTPTMAIALGELMIDTMKFSGSDMTAKLEALAIPANSSWRVTKRTKTWEKITLRQIARKIAKRYKLKLVYSASSIYIKSAEQSTETDSAFLYKLCQDNGLSMKVYQERIIIYDRGRWEKKAVVDTLTITDFEGDWDITDTIQGVYTGARAPYRVASKSSKKKSSSTKKKSPAQISAMAVLAQTPVLRATKKSTSKKKKKTQQSVFVGFVKEKSSKARNLKVTTVSDSKKAAGRKAAAQVNDENAKATVITGHIFPNPKIVAGVTIRLKGFGAHYDGKYFVDKTTISVEGSSGVSQNIEAHKCQKLLTYPRKARKTKKKSRKKSYDTIAKDVIRGKYGNGNARKKKLESLGYDYDKVQEAVDKLTGRGKK